ncbi:MAG TPA: type II toxin-antitoxin system antitoxin SocA domain-containing protein, partial [Chlamydiales bacterium]|nr:type II toxin-antitoxin system antitoxin SocA domain-containing protein [Chlamydiales bacterium]
MHTELPVSVLDVAAYILEKQPKNEPITAWKLQKLVYYCQAWSLVWDEKPLFKEKILAWANGPVVKELYLRH